MSIDQCFIDEASKILRVEVHRESAMEKLHLAMQHKSVDALKQAITECSALGIARNELPIAQEMLAEEEPKEAARTVLRDAIRGENSAELKAAVRLGEKARVERGLIEQATAIL